MSRYIIIVIIILIAFTSSEALCGVELIKYEYFKDGGTKCVTYKKNDNLTKVCINRRFRSKTFGKAFINGYPNDEKSRIMTIKEIKIAIKDLEILMNGDDYKKYTAKNLSGDEIRAIIQSSDIQKKRELDKTVSFGSVAKFKNELANIVEKGFNKEDAPGQKIAR